MNTRLNSFGSKLLQQIIPSISSSLVPKDNDVQMPNTLDAGKIKGGKDELILIGQEGMVKFSPSSPLGVKPFQLFQLNQPQGCL